MRSTTRPGRPTGRRTSSKSSRSVGVRRFGATCRRSSVVKDETSPRACSRIIGKRSRTCSSTPSPPSGPRGRDVRGVKCATRHTDPLRVCSISMRRATYPKPRASEIQRFKWATSAAHVAGRRLVSAEAATWLGEHFRVRLAEVRAAVDRFFVAGVNHIVYHGTAYSPTDDPWPGWQFYASVEFSPQNAWWDDFAALNTYVARVQSFLQSGRPDNDVLLYYPLYESLTIRGKSLLAHFGGAAPPAQGTTFEKAAETLQAAGFTYDFISDRQLRRVRTENRPCHHGRRNVVPHHRAALVPLRSSRNRFAGPRARTQRRDCRVFRRLAVRRERPDRSRRQTSALQGLNRSGDLRSSRRRRHQRSVQSAVAASFRDRILAACSHALTCSGSRCSTTDFSSHVASTRWAASTSSATRASARSTDGCRSTVARPRSWRSIRWTDAVDVSTARGSGTTREIYLQMPAGASLIVAESPVAQMKPSTHFALLVNPSPLPDRGPCAFVKGGPRLPSRQTVDRLGSWTTFGHDAEVFSGYCRPTRRRFRGRSQPARCGSSTLGASPRARGFA